MTAPTASHSPGFLRQIPVSEPLTSLSSGRDERMEERYIEESFTQNWLFGGKGLGKGAASKLFRNSP